MITSDGGMGTSQYRIINNLIIVEFLFFEYDRESKYLKKGFVPIENK